MQSLIIQDVPFHSIPFPAESAETPYPLKTKRLENKDDENEQKSKNPTGHGYRPNASQELILAFALDSPIYRSADGF